MGWGHAEVGGRTEGWWGALGWPRLWQSPQGQGLCLELSSGAWALTTLLASAGVGRPLTLGRSPAHPGVPPPALPPNGAPVFPSQAVDVRTVHLSGGSGGRSQSEAECVRNLERSLPTPHPGPRGTVGPDQLCLAASSQRPRPAPRGGGHSRPRRRAPLPTLPLRHPHVPFQGGRTEALSKV